MLKQSRAAGIFVVPGFRGNPMFDTVQELAPRCPELREIVRFDQWEDFLASGEASTLELPPGQGHAEIDGLPHGSRA